MKRITISLEDLKTDFIKYIQCVIYVCRGMREQFPEQAAQSLGVSVAIRAVRHQQ